MPVRWPLAIIEDGLQCIELLERFARLDQELHAFQVARTIEREREIDVNHAAVSGTAVAETQSDADVLEQAEVGCSQWIVTEGTSGVEERGAADAEQPERVPVRVVALLERQQCA